MGAVMTKVKITNANDLALAQAGHLATDQVRMIEVEGLVDTGASTLVVSTELADRLGLGMVAPRRVLVADGRSVQGARRGPVVIRILEREMIVEILAVPGARHVLIGQIPLEFFKLVVDPASGDLRYDPENPEGVLDALSA
jgi:clan AA aspartic protease